MTAEEITYMVSSPRDLMSLLAAEPAVMAAYSSMAPPIRRRCCRKV